MQSSWLPKLFSVLQDAWGGLAGVGVLLLLLIQVPFLGDVADRAGVNTESFRTVVIALVLTAVLLQLRRFDEAVSTRLARVSDLLTDQAERTSRQSHFVDPGEMYDALLKRARTIEDPAHKRLDVLGLTLFSAWPEISFWLQRDDVSDWQVHLSAVDHRYASPHIPEEWASESEVNLRSARSFARRPDIAAKGVGIHVSTYHFVPAVHGFRLGNGDLYVSTVLWDEEGRIGTHHFSYEFVAHNATGASAERYRRLFDNWLGRASHDPTSA